MQERLMILGAGVMQGPAIKIAKALGLETVVVDADPHAPCVSLADRFEQIDLKDQEGVAAFGQSLKAEGGLGGIMTAGTDFSATVAWAAARIGLPGIPYEAALNASDKERMRRCFEAAKLPSPTFMVVEGVLPATFAPPFGYPLVVKPVDNMGARGCCMVDCPEMLNPAVADALNFSRTQRVILEAYMEGPEFSVDALVYQGDIRIYGLADRHIFFPPYFIEMGHTMPTALNTAETENLLEVFKAGVRALGITNGAAKGDMKLTAQGPMIGEIAARLSGGYMSGWTYPYSSGVEVTRGAIQIALGRPPQGLEPIRRWTSAERAIISIPGTVRSVQGSEAAQGLTHVRDLFLKIKEGSRVRFPENNVSKCGNVISAAPTREAAVSAAEEATRRVLIRLKAPDTETEAFLAADAGDRGFPPGAFRVSPALCSLLEAFPEPEYGSGKILGSLETAQVVLLQFLPLIESGLRDYMGRTVQESLDAVRTLTGFPLPLREADALDELQLPGTMALGRRFWAALIRGGYQGAVYRIDTLVLRHFC
ncbi:MAG: ATP-grasp domain-containing protein [Spirochaetaceae bacterium]|jgi:biotin carboxylase|nr:ATP-grasp domain-containing protein [Spirochaetaceae bacterium]